MNPIVYRLSSLKEAPDFDAYEVNEETGEERIVGYVSTPYPHKGDGATLSLLTTREDGKYTWYEQTLSPGESYCDLTMLLHMSLMMRVVPRPVDHQWNRERSDRVRLSIGTLNP